MITGVAAGECAASSRLPGSSALLAVCRAVGSGKRSPNSWDASLASRSCDALITLINYSITNPSNTLAFPPGTTFIRLATRRLRLMSRCNPNCRVTRAGALLYIGVVRDVGPNLVVSSGSNVSAATVSRLCDCHESKKRRTRCYTAKPSLTTPRLS